MRKEASSVKKDVQESVIELVIARIEAQMSSDLRLSIGGTEGSLGKEKMIEHVRKGDDVGKQIINAHLNFIKAQTSGELVSALSKV